MTQALYDAARAQMPPCLWDRSLWSNDPERAPDQCSERQRWGIEAEMIDSLIWYYGRIGRSMVAIELGSGWGLGALVMSKLFKRVYTLTVNVSGPLEEWAPQWPDNVIPLELDLYGDDDWAALLRHSRAEIVRIDAKHTYEAVMEDVLNALRIPTVHTVFLDDYGFSDRTDPPGLPNAIVRSALHLMSIGVLECPDDLYLGPKAPFFWEKETIWLERPLVQGCYRKHEYLEGEVRMHYIFNSSHPSYWLVRPWSQDSWDISGWLGMSCHGEGTCKIYSSAYMNKSRARSPDKFESNFPTADIEVLAGWSCGLDSAGGAARLTWRAPPPAQLWRQFGKPILRYVDDRAEWPWLFCPEPDVRSALITDEESGVVLGKATRLDNIRAMKGRYGGVAAFG